jgi:integrase
MARDDDATRYLWNRGSAIRQNWYLKLTIPTPLRRVPPFSPDGKERPHIVRQLHTGDFSLAQRRRDNFVVAYRKAFDSLLKGNQLTLKQIEEFTEAAAADIKVDARYSVTARIFQEVTAPAQPKGETITQACTAYLAEKERKGVIKTTRDEYKDRVDAFVKFAGDLRLVDITRDKAADFVTHIAEGRKTRTINKYSGTLRSIFESAKRRGRVRVEADNPFSGHRITLTDEQKEEAKRDPFTDAQVWQILDSLKPEVRPAEHTPASALPWITLIGAYSGARIEEIAGLTAKDVHDEGANGSVVKVLDFNPKNRARKRLKNLPSKRRVPVHSALIRAGLMDYISHLPANGPLIPGLTARKSDDNKVSGRVSELFADHLTALGITSRKLVFHSWRNTVTDKLRHAEPPVPKDGIDAIVGHANGDITFDIYSSGPKLKHLASYVERIAYGR